MSSSVSHAAAGRRSGEPAIFVATAQIPWTAIPGFEDQAAFKLLRVDPQTLGTTMLFRYRSGIDAHKHFGAVEILTLSGRWWYEGEGSAGPGDYTYEHAGSTHIAFTENNDWTEAFIISRGPQQLIGPDGAPGLVADGLFFYQIAAANGAATHLPKPNGV